MPSPMRTWGFAQWGTWGRPDGRTTGRATGQNETPAQRAQRERELVANLLSGIMGGASSTIQREQERAAAEQRQAAELALARLREQGLTERAQIDRDRPVTSPQFQVQGGGTTQPAAGSGITGTQLAIGAGVLGLGAWLAFGKKRR